jgi:hypothetical protein
VPVSRGNQGPRVASHAPVFSDRHTLEMLSRQSPNIPPNTRAAAHHRASFTVLWQHAELVRPRDSSGLTSASVFQQRGDGLSLAITSDAPGITDSRSATGRWTA